MINLFIAFFQPRGLVGIFFNKTLTSVCWDCPLSIIFHKWGPETPSSVCVCVCHCFCKHTHTVIFGWMSSTHHEHRNETNTLAQVIEQPAAHTESYLYLTSRPPRGCWFFPWYWILMHFFFCAPVHTRVTCHQQVIWNMRSLHYMVDFIPSSHGTPPPV